MNHEEFITWRHSPDNRPFFQYLTDAREAVKEEWAVGNQITDKDHAIAMTYGDLLALEWKDVADFYGLEEQDERELSGD